MKKWNKTKKNCGKAFFCCSFDWEIPVWFPVWVWCFHLSDYSKVLFRKIYAQICLSWCSFKIFFLHLLSIFLHFFQYSIMFISNCNEIFFVCFVWFAFSIQSIHCVCECVCFFRTKRCIPRKVDSLAPQKESLPSSSRLRQIWLDSLSFIINIK